MNKHIASLLVLVLSFTINVNATQLFSYSYETEPALELDFERIYFGDGTPSLFFTATESDGSIIWATDGTYVKSGVTEDGHEFIAFAPPTENINSSRNIETFQISDSIFVERGILLQGNVRPNPTILWSETINGRR